MLTRNTAIEILKDFIKECADKNIFFKKVILFGSTVTGNTHEYSDIDVALVSDRFTGNILTDIHLISPIMVADKKFYIIEPKTFSTKEDEEGIDPFFEDIIKKTGIEIK